jgi:hypothetical protein
MPDEPVPVKTAPKSPPAADAPAGPAATSTPALLVGVGEYADIALRFDDEYADVLGPLPAPASSQVATSDANIVQPSLNVVAIMVGAHPVPHAVLRIVGVSAGEAVVTYQTDPEAELKIPVTVVKRVVKTVSFDPETVVRGQ